MCMYKCHCVNRRFPRNMKYRHMVPLVQRQAITRTDADLFLEQTSVNMMTSSNGSIFSVTGPLRGEFTGPGEFPTQRQVTRNFDVFFDLRLNKRLSKQPWGWWFETPSWSLWRQYNDYNGNSNIVTEDNVFANAVCKMSAILLRSPCANLG